MVEKIERRLVRPVVVPLVIAAIAGAIIVTIGKSLLALHTEGTPQYERLELGLALGFALLVLVVAAVVATRPAGATGPLERDVAIGHRPMFAPELPPVDVAARNGPLGTVGDIQPGDTLYARSGALARVVGLIPGSDEHGRRYRGFIYAQGVFGASDELWIPVEAVMAVYPETHSVFLAIKGDETEAFGWNRPPTNVSRARRDG